MVNTMNFNSKPLQIATIAVLNDVLNSDTNGKNMEDVYSTVCRYSKISRVKFEELYNQAEENLESWEKDGRLFCPPKDDEYMIEGGCVSSFFESIGKGIKTAARITRNFVKEHAVLIAMITAFSVINGGIEVIANGSALDLFSALVGDEIIM